MLGFKENIEEVKIEIIVKGSMAEPNPMFKYFFFCLS